VSTPTRPRRVVQYRHHTRLPDGVVPLFVDPSGEDSVAVHCSSPVVGVRRIFASVLDAAGRGDLASFIVATENTECVVKMPVAAEEYLAAELVLGVV
jgi:hypothetical protein